MSQLGVVATDVWRALRWVIATVAISCVLAAASATTSFAANFTWSGASTASQDWSDSGNWIGKAAPSGTVGTLEFPALTNTECAELSPKAACYHTLNNVSGLIASAIAFHGRYSINEDLIAETPGESLTLGSGGLTVAGHNSGASLNVPLALSGTQTWKLEGGGLGLDRVTSSNALTIELSNSSFVESFRGVETGPIAIVGSNSVDTGSSAMLNGGISVGVLDPVDDFNSDINGEDLNPVHVTDAVLMASPTASPPSRVGPLTITGGEVRLFVPGGGCALNVYGGMSLDSMSAVTLFLSPPSDGCNNTQIAATGPASLGEAHLVLRTIAACEELTAGKSFTLVRTTSSLSGTFGGLPNGSTMAVQGCSAPSVLVQITYTTNAATATVEPVGPPPTIKKLSPKKGPSAGGTTVTITGTGLAGTSSVKFGSASATGVVVNSPTTVTAKAPAHSKGVVDVTITAAGGPSAITKKDHFKYTK